MEIDKIKLGKRINQIRLSRKDTLESFANTIQKETESAIKTNKSNVQKWEKGLNIPNDLTLQAIAELGEITVNELLYGTKEERLNVIAREVVDIVLAGPDQFNQFRYAELLGEYEKLKGESYAH